MGSYYWLKLNKNIFKRHDMLDLRTIFGLQFEAMFIHLMAESIDHDGCLRYSEKKPYTARTLAPIVSTDEKTMKEALEAFEELELIEILEDGTIRIPLAVENIGSETEWASKKRQFRDKKRTQEGQSEDNVLDMSSGCPNNVQNVRGQKRTMSDKSIELRDKSIENREEIDNDKSLSLSSRAREIPKKDDVIRFAHEQKINRVIDAEQFWSFYEDQEWKIEGKPIRDWKSLLMKWASNVRDRKNIQTKFMENEYSSEHLKKREEESLKLLDDLLQN